EKNSEKFAAMEQFLDDSPFDSIGDFLSILFHRLPHSEPDPRSFTHATAVARFLRGLMDIKMPDILPLMYHHHCSFPAKNSVRIKERESMFCTTGEPSDIHHARPFMSTWATRLVAAEARKQTLQATKEDPDDPESRVRLRASTNGRGHPSVHVVTWKDFKNFSIDTISNKYWVKLKLPMLLSQYMAAPRVKGVFVECKRRPYPMIQVAALSSFILAQNPYANGDMAMLLGIGHFVCKYHVDVKRVYCRFGNTVADSTARAALQSMTDASMAEMLAETEEASSRDEVEHCICLDNVQEHDALYEQGTGRVSRVKVGTAGTKIKLRGCAPKAFDAQAYYSLVARKERKTMTVMSLFDDIDWDHERQIQRLHWARFQPLMLNSECKTSISGMIRTVGDFDGQVGVDVKKHPNLLEWVRGDGASFANLLRASRYCASVGNFRNKFSLPEIWRTGACDLNSVSENHYDPATSSDPSSLSKASSTAGLKRPSNVKSYDYYPIVRNLSDSRQYAKAKMVSLPSSKT
ncbi:hypothetical protein B0H17DRAFT_933727, partial [Mycena rosella]